MASTLSLPQCVNIIPQTDPRHLRRRTPIIYAMSVTRHDVNMKIVQIRFLFPQNYSAHQGLVLLLTDGLPPSWWRHQMETFSALLAICAGNSLVPGEFPTQRPKHAELLCFLWSTPNKRLSKHWRGWWFETLSSPLWRHCNDCSLPSLPPFQTV